MVTGSGQRVYHLALTRAELLRLLRAAGGPEGVLVGFTGTLAEAIAAVHRDPRRVFVADPSCDRQHARGHCLGHPRPRCVSCGAWLVLTTPSPHCPSCGEV